MKKPFDGDDAKLDPAKEAEPYKVGPGHPPREYQFKPGQSGNPKGKGRKSDDINIGEILTRYLKKKVSVTRDGKRESTTAIEIGIEQLINHYAKGDRHARRELMDYAHKFGLPIFGEASDKIAQLMQPNDQDILDRYVAKKSEQNDRSSHSPVLAPPELLDDDDTTAEDN